MGAEGEGGTNWESSPLTTITICETRKLVEISSVPQGANDKLEGWDGVRGGREVREGENIRIPIAGCCWYMGEMNSMF